MGYHSTVGCCVDIHRYLYAVHTGRYWRNSLYRFLLCGHGTLDFFSTSLADMTDLLVSNVGLVTKIYFPREILPISLLLARLLDAAIVAGVLLVLMILYRQPLFWAGWLYLPFILGVQLALILGLGLALSALNVFYRDVRHIVALGLQLWFYATPIIYPVSAVPESLRKLYFLNPMAGIIEAYRAVVIYQQLPGTYLALSAAISLVVLVVGYWFFKRVEFQLADVV